MTNSDHNGHHDHAGDHSELSETEIRVRALESIFVSKGYVDPSTLDVIIDLYENKIGPKNGARVVVKAWTDPAFKQWLLTDGTAAVASMGYTGHQGEHIVVPENTPDVHNIVVCTLCSCYPWPLLGLPPSWYKSAAYRSRVVLDPRSILAEFGVTLPDTTKIKIWDSTSEMRYLVLPMQPPASIGWSEDKLIELVNRDSMIGTRMATDPATLS
jgi:nitrile hydratase